MSVTATQLSKLILCLKHQISILCSIALLYLHWGRNRLSAFSRVHYHAFEYDLWLLTRQQAFSAKIARQKSHETPLSIPLSDGLISGASMLIGVCDGIRYIAIVLFSSLRCHSKSKSPDYCLHAESSSDFCTISGSNRSAVNATFDAVPVRWDKAGHRSGFHRTQVTAGTAASIDTAMA